MVQTSIRYPIRFFVLLLPFFLNAQKQYPQDYFASPLNIPLYASGTFGELRTNHFHSGIDLKTKGRIGLPILAAAEGTVVRIKVSPYGFGRALYLKHPNGYTTVYAHLHEFAPEIEAYVISEMRRKQSNEINLFPPPGKFSYAQGDEIAKSGNSGGSGGPHLHYEIRDSRTEKIINPLLFGLKVSDHRPPLIGPLQVYSFRNGEPQGRKEYSLKKLSDKLYVPEAGVIEASGELSFGLYAIDKQDGSANRNGVYELKLYLGDQLAHCFKMETFAFSETRYINAHIDYELKNCCRRASHLLYLEPGNKLSTYPQKALAGHISFEKDTILPICIEAWDVAGNLTKLDFQLNYRHQVETPKNEDLKESDEVVAHADLDYQKAQLLKHEDYQLDFKAGSFYRNYRVAIAKESRSSDFGPIYRFGERSIPVHRYFDLKLKLPNLPRGLDPGKLFIASYGEGRFDDYEGGYYQNGWLITRTRQLGEFGIAIDTLAPDIKAQGFKNGSRIKPKATLIIKIDDDLSGIDSYNAWVNEQWVPIYFDAKTRRLILKTEYWPQKEAAKQVLKLRVEDDRKNQSEKIWELFVS